MKITWRETLEGPAFGRRPDEVSGPSVRRVTGGGTWDPAIWGLGSKR